MLDLLSKETILKEYPLKKIIRYNNRNRLQDESVAEHTCFVSLFCLKIMSQLNLSHEQERKVLILAALHDASESYTSDIPYDVKNNYPEIQKTLEKAEEEYYKQNWEKYSSDVLEPEPLIYNILKLADSYSVYQWCLNEKMLGNVFDYVNEIYFNSLSRIEFYTNKINELIMEE